VLDLLASGATSEEIEREYGIIMPEDVQACIA